jgi:hypothetical protein
MRPDHLAACVNRGNGTISLPVFALAQGMTFKWVVFGVLLALAVLSGLRAAATEPDFRNSVWSEAFWLVSSTLATTFILQALLERDARRRRRQELQFGFRSFTAFAARLILKTLGLDDASSVASLQKAVISGNLAFRQVLQDIAASVSSADRAKLREFYDEFYLNTGNHLAALGRDYVRVFSSSAEDMLLLYENLQHAAAEWRYRQELTKMYEQHTLEMTNDSDRGRRMLARTRVEDEVLDLSNRTFSMLVDLARRVEKGAGYYKD